MSVQICEIRGARRRGASTSKVSAYNWTAYGTRCASLRLLRQNGIHVDTKITTTDGFSDLVHWQVFSASCPKLIERSQLISSARTKATRVIGHVHMHVELPACVNGAMARLLVECAYGESELSLNHSNMDEFYRLCRDFELPHGVRACLNHSRRLLNANNCVYLLQLALNHNHHKLKRAAYLMMRSHFKLVLNVNRDFHKLDFDCLERLLLDDRLALEGHEELGWLAIMRWLTTKPMTKARLASLYNQMVAGPQDLQINLFHSNNSTAINQQPQAAVVARRHSATAAAVAPVLQSPNSQQIPLRITLNFHSSSSSSDGLNGNKRKQRPGAQTNAGTAASPLKTAANEAFYLAIPSSFVDEHKLERLIKCLRFLRFRSVNAFELIASHPLVSCRAHLVQLITMMRIKYKLWHQITLTSQEEAQIVGDESIRDLGDRMQRANRTRRVFKRVTRFVRSAATTTARRNNQQTTQAALEPSGANPRASLLELEMVRRATKPRVPNSIGLLLGGWQDGTISKTIWSYDFIYDKWFKLNLKMPEPRALHASCASPSTGHVYIFGGTNGTRILNSVWRFNPVLDVHLKHKSSDTSQQKSQKQPKNYVTKKSKLLWRTIKGAQRQRPSKCSAQAHQLSSYKFKQLCPMNEFRCHLAGVWHQTDGANGRLYALGGHNGSQRLKSAEWYDEKCNKWHPIADMTIARSDAAACSHENKIFIAGGQIGDQFIQTSVEFYKPSDDSWTFAAPMIIPRMSFCLTSYKGQLFALGGTNGLMGGDEIASVTRSVERYSPESGSWTFCVPMAQKRCSFGALKIGNKLLVIGGHGGSRRLKCCESLRVAQLTATPQVHNASVGPASWQQADPSSQAVARQHQQQQQQQVAPSSNQRNVISSRSNAVNHGQNQRSSSLTSGNNNNSNRISNNNNNQLNLRILNNNSQQLTLRNAMRWEARANLPERRSGFSLVVVDDVRNARDYTYFGTTNGQNKLIDQTNRPRLIRQPSYWNKFKLIKRRRLIKHLKIALVVSIVILMM